MPRQDIDIDAKYGEVTTTDNRTNKVVYDFALLGRVEGVDNDHYIYGEICVPLGFEGQYKESSGVHVTIPYHPSSKQLRVRFKIDTPAGDTEYVINTSDNRVWFTVYHDPEDGDKVVLLLSEYGRLNANGHYTLVLRRGYLAIYSGDDTDFMFRASLNQNEMFMLKAAAGNLYQYPTTGVGLIDFLHGNFENSGLAAKLQAEFENDKMIINNAYMNSETGELLLEVIEKNG